MINLWLLQLEAALLWQLVLPLTVKEYLLHQQIVIVFL